MSVGRFTGLFSESVITRFYEAAVGIVRVCVCGLDSDMDRDCTPLSTRPQRYFDPASLDIGSLIKTWLIPLDLLRKKATFLKMTCYSKEKSSNTIKAG